MKTSAIRSAFILATLAVAISSASAADFYGGVRLWDDGPFYVWDGVNGDDPRQRVFAIQGPQTD